MKKLVNIFAVLAGSVSFLQVSDGNEKPIEKPQAQKLERDPTTNPAELASASNANGHFAVDLYKRLAETESGKNVFVSPFSISIALTMAAEGAVDQTLQQMTDVLRLPQGGLAGIHRGQAGLQKAVIPTVSPQVTERIAKLRADLMATNKRTESLSKNNKFDEARASSLVGDKLAKELNSLLKQTSAYELQIANALWLEKTYPLQPNFVATLKPSYGTALFPVDFKKSPEPVRLQINEWVSRQTNKHIQDLLAPQDITDRTRLVITNAVFFKGDWALPFETSGTRPETFHQSKDRAIKLPMMHQRNYETASYGAFQSSGELFPTPLEVRVDLKDDDPSLYPDAKGHTMLSLDYQGGKIQMILLVPQSASGLFDLEKSLTYESLQRWITQMENRTVDLSLPKYKLEAKYSVSRTLQSLGMVRAFQDPGQNPEGAQFDKLSSSQRPEDRLFISDVLHKTYIDVGEVGTEAAAATAVIFAAPTSAAFDRPKTRPFVPIFKANKPFLFLIRDRETASILFLGRYTNPRP